jgi:predicted metal-dependent peptidase
VNEAQVDPRTFAAARVWAVARMPYLAGALFACQLRAVPGSGTVAVDRRWRILADPAVVDALGVEQLGRLLIHLCGHLIRDHAGRAERLGVTDGGRARWNRCADAEINDDLLFGDAVPSAAPDLPRDLGCEPGGLAEAYYDATADGPRRWDCGAGADGCEQGDDEGGVGPDQAEMLRLAVAAEIQRAEGRRPGSVAAGWLRWAEYILPSRVDWRRALAAEVRRAVALVAGRVDYSYRRPSRRATDLDDVILPALVRPLPDVAIVCDTSGSMHDRLLARALAEIEGVLARAGLRQQRVRVLAVDSAVHAVRAVSSAKQVSLAGGGGTDMGAGLEAAAALRPRPAVVVVLTDGYTPWPERPPRGIRVVVGLLREDPDGDEWMPPAWARTVVIDEGP